MDGEEMNDRVKITIAYMDEDQLKAILNALNPIISGAKIRKNDTHKPYKHAYITLRNGIEATKQTVSLDCTPYMW